MVLPMGWGSFALWLWIALGATFYLMASLLMASFFLRRSRPPIPCPPITLLKPLAGSDETLYDNLKSFFAQAYADYQIVFGVKSSNDPALASVERLRREFPGRDVAVTISDAAVGVNPKTSNLAQMIATARHDILVVTDADVRADAQFLSRVAAAFADERVGAATAFCLIPCRSFWSALHAYVWGIDRLSFLLVAKFVGTLRFGNGCATAVRRSVLEQGGGFASFADRVGDGYWWPNLAWQAGKRVEILDRTLLLTGAPEDGRSLYRLHERYVREQRALEPVGSFFIILTFGWLPAAVYALASGGQALSLEMLLGMLVLRLSHPLMAGLFHRDARMLAWLWIMPLREVWCLFLWFLSYAGRTVHWRGQEFRIEPGGVLVAADVSPDADDLET